MKQVIWKTALKPAPMQAGPLPAGAMIHQAQVLDTDGTSVIVLSARILVIATVTTPV